MKHLLAIALILLLAAGIAVAADLDGTWKLVFDTEAGERVGMMDIKANGTELNAKFRAEGSPDGLDVKGTLTNGEISFSFPFHSPDAGYEAALNLKAKLEDGKLNGTWEFDSYTGTFAGTKQ